MIGQDFPHQSFLTQERWKFRPHCELLNTSSAVFLPRVASTCRVRVADHASTTAADAPLALPADILVMRCHFTHPNQKRSQSDLTFHQKFKPFPPPNMKKQDAPDHREKKRNGPPSSPSTKMYVRTDTTASPTPPLRHKPSHGPLLAAIGKNYSSERALDLLFFFFFLTVLVFLFGGAAADSSASFISCRPLATSSSRSRFVFAYNAEREGAGIFAVRVNGVKEKSWCTQKKRLGVLREN